MGYCVIKDGIQNQTFLAKNQYPQKKSCELKYSSVPNRPVGRNNRVGWIFHGNLLNVQGEIIMQAGFFTENY